MSEGGGKPRGGRMGTSIKESVSGETVANAEKELGQLTEQLDLLRRKIGDVVRHYQTAEKAEARLEMELAKCKKEIDSLNAQHVYIEKQLDSLRHASKPKKNEVNRLEELGVIILMEEKELEKLSNCSAKLKEKVSDLQKKIDNAGGEKLKSQKAMVKKIQTDIDKASTEINPHKVKISIGAKMIKKSNKSIEESIQKQKMKRRLRRKIKCKICLKKLNKRL